MRKLRSRLGETLIFKVSVQIVAKFRTPKMDAKSDMEKRVLKIRKKTASGLHLDASACVLDGPGFVRDTPRAPQEQLRRAPRAEQEPGRALCNALERTSRIDLRGTATKDTVLEASRLRFGGLQQ